MKTISSVKLNNSNLLIVMSYQLGAINHVKIMPLNKSQVIIAILLPCKRNSKMGMIARVG